jgi:SAM-dependent methyltransferase
MADLVVPSNITKYDNVYEKGYDKKYPNVDLVRLEGWYFDKKPGSVLDYGAGTGVNGIHMMECGYDVVFMDASTKSVRLIEKKLLHLALADEGTRVLQLEPDANSLPLEDGTLDYVVCMSVLSLLETKGAIEHLIGEFHRVLRPGGKMIIDINGPESDFATKGKFIGDDVFEYNLYGDQTRPIRCYCPKTKGTFAELFGSFITDEIGHVSFQYYGQDSYEFVALVRKPG